MTGHKDNFQPFEEFSTPVPVHGVGKAVIHAYGKGEVALQSTIDLSTHLISKVSYVPVFKNPSYLATTLAQNWHQ